MEPLVVSIDQAFNFTIKVRKGEGKTFMFQFLEDSSSHDISSYGFEFSVHERENETPIFTLTEDTGGGLSNGGSTGQLQVTLANNDIDLDPSTYEWKLKITNPSTLTWGHGLFPVNTNPNTSEEADSGTVNLDLGDKVIEVNLIVSGLDITNLSDSQKVALAEALMSHQASRVVFLNAVQGENP